MDRHATHKHNRTTFILQGEDTPKYELLSKTRAADKEHQAGRGALDGSRCWFSLTTDSPLIFGECPLCAATTAKCPSSFSLDPGKPKKFSIRLGQAPDLSNSLRGAIENALQGLNPGSAAEIATSAPSPAKVGCTGSLF